VTRVRAYVVVTIESDGDLKLSVKHISVVDYPAALMASDLVFEWFSMIGTTIEAARQNCLDSIAFYARCRPGMKDAIVAALDPSCAEVVRAMVDDTEAQS